MKKVYDIQTKNSEYKDKMIASLESLVERIKSNEKLTFIGCLEDKDTTYTVKYTSSAIIHKASYIGLAEVLKQTLYEEFYNNG